MDNEYNILKEQAATQKRLADQNLAKRMADMKVSDTPLSIQSRNMMADRAVQGSIGQAEQAYNTQQGFMNNQFGLQNQANLANIQTNQIGNQAEQEINQENRKYNIYYQLWRGGKMTASQFRKLTGIDVRSYSASRAKPQTNPEDFFNNPDFKDAPMLDNFATSAPAVNYSNTSQILKR